MEMQSMIVLFTVLDKMQILYVNMFFPCLSQ